MGHRGAWAAFQGIGKDEVLRRLALVETGARGEVAFRPFSCLEVANGWCVVVAEYQHEPFDVLNSMSELSYGCRIAVGMDEEHVNISEASMHENGKLLWRVSHLGDGNNYDLDHEGDLPPQFEVMRDATFRKQDEATAAGEEVDYVFSLPADLAFSVCGYRWDHGIDEHGDSPYRELKPAKADSAGKRRGLLELLGFDRRKSP